MSQILTVHFNSLVAIGPEAVHEQRIHNGQPHGGLHTLTVDFDDDPRFLLVQLTHRDTKGVYEQLVSMGSVAAILMKEKRVSDQSVKPAKK